MDFKSELNTLTITLLLALSFTALLAIPIPTAHAASTWYVAPSPAGTGLSGGSCAAPGENTIQAAVTAAAPGDTIVVCPGSYTEQVTISQSLILTGMPGTTILAPGVLVADAHSLYNIVEIKGGATVSISGFTISGPGPSGCGSIHYGIFVIGGAFATISSNSIVHLRDNPLSGCQNGGGIRVGSNALVETGTAIITKNVISDYQKGGIVVDGPGSSATVTNNLVQGVGATTAIAQNGIQVSRGASGIVTDNTIIGNVCTIAVTCGPNWETQTASTGILTYPPSVGSLSITGNTLVNNDIGLALYSDNPGTVTVTSNVLSGIGYTGIAENWGVMDQDESATVSKNMFFSNPTGIEVISDAGGTATATISCNRYFSVATHTHTDWYAPSIAGSATISGSDSGCLPSTGSYGSLITPFTGSGTFNQISFTGVSVAISGSTSSPSVTVASEGLTSPFTGVPVVTLDHASYYSVMILGASTGTANVCVNDAAATSSTTLQYYNGASWVGATGVVATPFVKVCGNIPVSALADPVLGAGDPPAIPAFPLPFAIPLVLAATALIYLAMRRRLQV
jgi:hypothetical protein